MTEPLYTTEILRLAASLNEPHELEREDGRAELRSPTCGSRIKLAVQLDEERRVERLSMRVHACAFGQASAALVERHCRGRSHNDVSDALLALSHWLANDQEAPSKEAPSKEAPSKEAPSKEAWPGIGALEPARSRMGRHGAILLPFRALLAAMEASG